MTLFSNLPGDEGLPGHERARVLAAVMTTTLMGVFDGTMINIALPSMARAMQVPANVAVWFANGYLLSAAMTLAIFAALAARGLSPGLSAGLATFTLTSLGCALATTPEMLTGMRILQGMGGDPEYRSGDPAVRFSGATAGPHSGAARPAYRLQHGDCPVLGGTILDALSWQWLFAINLIPGSIALLLAWRALPRESAVDRRPLTPGAVLSAVLLGSAIMLADSLQHVTQHINRQAVFWGVLALVSALAFIWRIRRAQHPLLPPVMETGAYPRRADLAGLVCQSGHHLCRAAVPVSERVWLQPGGLRAAVHPVADWHRADRAARGSLGRYDFRAADLDPRADDFCRWAGPAGHVAGQSFRMEYLPAQPGLRDWVWLLPEPQ
jgi:DHA2 family multidrug resistance protein-like MFS transporter